MTIWINEFHYDNSGVNDPGEFMEVAGTAGTNLEGWKLVLYNGGTTGTSAVVYNTIALSGIVPDQSNGIGTLRFPAVGLQNGPFDGFALVDASNTVVQFLSYEGVITAAPVGTTNAGPAAGMTSTDVAAGETNATPEGTSLQLTGSGNQYSDFTWAATASGTPDALNNNQTITAAGPDTTPPQLLTTRVTDLQHAADIVLRVSENVTLDVHKVRLVDSEKTVVAADVSLDGQNLRINPTADLGVSRSYEVVLDAGALTDTALNPIAAATVSVTTAAPPTITRIHDVQGTGATNAKNGQIVTVEAIVFGDFQNGDTDAKRDQGGFFLQEAKADQDADAATSEGIFIYEGAGAALADVKAGDRVQVTGTVSEFGGKTQITATQVAVVQNQAVGDVAAELAVAISLPAAGAVQVSAGKYQADLKAYESMLVRVSETLTITEQFDLDRYGQITLTAGDRPFQFTANNAPDTAGYAAHVQNLARHQIVYDDGLSKQNAPIDNLDGFAGYNTANAPRMGDTIDGLTGVLDYYASAWRVRSVEDGTVSVNRVNARQDAPDDVGGRLKLAGLNLLNYFKTLDANGAMTEVNLAPRGANSQAEFDRQTDKLVNTLLKLDADVLGVVEVENDFTNGAAGNALDYLVDKLNAKLAPADHYAWVDPGTKHVGTDAIAVGVIYRPGVVKIAAGTTVATLNDATLATLDGGQALLDQSAIKHVFDGESTSRNPLAVTFEEIATGEQFTAVVNHLKSKGSAAPAGGPANAENLDGAGAWNQQRELAATAVAKWLATNPTGSADADQVLLGDFNAYAKENPLKILAEAGYGNLEDRLAKPYSYVFDGQLGTLDYVLATSSLNPQITGVTQWHLNSDDADALDYNLDFNRSPDLFDATVATRVSDHDPLLIGLNLGAGSTPTPTPTPTPDPTPIVAPPAGGTVSGTTGNDVLQGEGGNDILIGGGGNDKLTGGDGRDLAVFGGSRAAFTVTLGSDGLPVGVQGAGGTNVLSGVERLVFEDVTLAFDVDAAPGKAYRLYEALLGRAPDRDGISFWVEALDKNPGGLQSVVNGFLSSPEFTARAGNTAQLDSGAYVDMLYQQIFNRPADAQGRAFWRDALENGLSRADLVLGFSESVEHVQAVAPVLVQGIALDPVAV